ncbi:Uncharacterised protein [Mycobacteroides abscessus subsp. abscessus]|nr:Uncharacterised protein [Mycobacteroides abscessus subsp. abscessus]
MSRITVLSLSNTATGVPAGAINPFQFSASNSGSPALAIPFLM